MNSYSKNVFLNYPFQASHQPIVDSMIFSTLACGFSPRSAEEDTGSLDQRIDRIVKLVAECKHAIHDLSESTNAIVGSPRLNMPFELGIFYGAKRLGDQQHREKQALVFDAVTHNNLRSFSDTAGLDLQHHMHEPKIAMLSIQRYLKRFAKWEIVPPASLLRLFFEYKVDVPILINELGLLLDNLCFEERRGLMGTWLQRKAQQRNKPFH